MGVPLADVHFTFDGGIMKPISYWRVVTDGHKETQETQTTIVVSCFLFCVSCAFCGQNHRTDGVHGID